MSQLIQNLLISRSSSSLFNIKKFLLKLKLSKERLFSLSMKENNNDNP